MSVWTLRRRLRDFRLYGRLSHKKPFVSLGNRVRRLNLSKDHSDWTVEDWKKMLFTDKIKVNSVGSDSKSYIRRFKGENFNSQFIKGHLQAGGGSILMWGAFLHDGICPIVQIQNTFNSEKCIELLEETVEPFVKENMARRFVYQQDNISVHKSKRVLAWLKKHKFKKMDWPPQSPDINPIENLWAFVKKKNGQKKCKNTKELYETFVHEWNSIPPEICQNLVKLMPKRIKAVIIRYGCPCSY